MIKSVFKGIKPFMAKYEPEILLGMGVSGMIFSTVWGVRATVKAVRKLDAKKEELNTDSLTIKETVKEVWPLYLPVIISTGLSIPCVIASNKVNNRRNAALATAFTISERTLQEYQDKTKEIIGEKKEQEIHEAISKKAVENQQKGTVLLTGDGDSLFLEPISGRYFKSNWNKIQKCANEVNAEALTNFTGTVTLTEWFYALGLPATDISDNMGWQSINGQQGLIDVEIDSVLKDDTPCGAIYYRNPPKSLQ